MISKHQSGETNTDCIDKTALPLGMMMKASITLTIGDITAL